MSENSWLKYFAELSSNDAANKNLKAFKDATVGSDELLKRILFSVDLRCKCGCFIGGGIEK